jgi:hypothetical protein
MEAGTAATLFCLAIGVLIAYPSLKSLFRIWGVTKKLIDLRDDMKGDAKKRNEKSLREFNLSERLDQDTQFADRESEGIYITSERYRITKPTEWFAFTMFGVEGMRRDCLVIRSTIFCDLTDFCLLVHQ